MTYKADNAIRVMLVEDHLVVRMGLRTLIEHQTDMELADEARTGVEAVERYAAARADVVLMDLRLPGIDGVAATSMILKQAPAARILVFSSFDSQADLVKAHAAGARGYILKTADGGELLSAIRDVHAGHKHFPAALAERLAASKDAPPLTARDRQLLQHVVNGLNNPQIAKATGLSRGTVRIYLTRLFAKLQVSNRTEATTMAFHLGLMRPDSAQGTPIARDD